MVIDASLVVVMFRLSKHGGANSCERYAGGVDLSFVWNQKVEQ
jgi:hypothetical protein